MCWEPVWFEWLPCMKISFLILHLCHCWTWSISWRHWILYHNKSAGGWFLFCFVFVFCFGRKKSGCYDYPACSLLFLQWTLQYCCWYELYNDSIGFFNIRGVMQLFSPFLLVCVFETVLSIYTLPACSLCITFAVNFTTVLTSLTDVPREDEAY